jgi:uncharacterized membrane protein YfcA
MRVQTVATTGRTKSVLELTLLVWLGAAAAGVVGALTGLGGGIIIVPMLTLLFNVDMRYAIGAALVAVIDTSSGAAAAYVRKGYSNIRVGMFLEVATPGPHLRVGGRLRALLPVLRGPDAARRVSVTARMCWSRRSSSSCF